MLKLLRKKGVAKNAKKKGRVKIGKGMFLKRGQEEKLSKKPGSSNIGEYKKVSKGKFCGPSGGSGPATYPVNTKKRCRAALSYARNSPNPAGIRACVKKKCGETSKAKNSSKGSRKR